MLNLPSRLAVATHTHRSRHGNNNTDTHCLTEDGIVAQKKKTKTKNKKQQTPNQKKGGGRGKKLQGNDLKVGGEGKGQKLHYYQAISIFKNKVFRKDLAEFDR